MTTFHKSRHMIDIPNIDLLSYIFSSGDEHFRERPSYYDAHQPHRCYSLAEGEVMAKRVGKGLNNLGIRENNKVVLFSGNNLYLLLHPGVSDVAVVGAKAPDGGEYPRAFVVKKDMGLMEREVSNIIQEKFSKHKFLTGGVFFIDEIPKTGSGKVMKRKLPDIPLRLSRL